MQEARRSLVAALGVVAVIGATVGGGLVRSRMEIGPGVPVGGSITVDGLVTSTQGLPGSTEASNVPISESTYFYQLTQLLEREFVDPITDEEALATGAVRGMINSLADSESLFYKPEPMAALIGRMRGEFAGIGVETRLVYDKEEQRKLQNRSIGPNGTDEKADVDVLLLIPTVVVSTVVPGSPADKAGIKVGDRIIRLDKKWALSSIEVEELRTLREGFDQGKMTAEELQEQMDVFRTRFESSIAPGRAAERLMTDTSGEIDLAWRDASGKDHSARVARSKSQLRRVSLDGKELTLRFLQGADEELSDLSLPSGEMTIDLRQSSVGDFEVMRRCLALLAPAGNYGSIKREQAGAAQKLSVSNGAERRHFRLLVDNSTWGAAAVFALALESAGLATIEGSLPVDLPWIEVYKLPDGSGYTLRTGTFEANGGAK